MEEEKETIESKLISIILTVFNLQWDAVNSRCRKEELAICRQTIDIILKEELNYSFSEAGGVTGRSHCTAIHSRKAIKNILDTNFQPYADYIRRIKHLCNIIDTGYPKIEVQNYIFYEHSKLIIN